MKKIISIIIILISTFSYSQEILNLDYNAVQKTDGQTREKETRRAEIKLNFHDNDLVIVFNGVRLGYTVLIDSFETVTDVSGLKYITYFIVNTSTGVVSKCYQTKNTFALEERRDLFLFYNIFD